MVNSQSYQVDNDVLYYKQILDQLSVSTSGLVLKGTQVCVPKKLQHKIIESSHEGHIGVAKMKALLR